MNDRPTVNMFISYAHVDSAIKNTFFAEISARLRTSKEFCFSFSSDRDILVGDNWDKEIKEMIKRCDFGLLLLSTNFLVSEYITTEELLRLSHKCLPVALKFLDVAKQDLKGIGVKQIFFYNGKSYNELKQNNRDRYINDLAIQIENRVRKQCISPGTAEESVLNDCSSLRIVCDRLLQYRAPNYRNEQFVHGGGVLFQISHNPDNNKIGDTVIALDYLKRWVLDSEVPYFVLFGDSGSGKSFTCRMLARELISLHDKDPDTCPLCIYIDLRMVDSRVGGENRIPNLADILQNAIEKSKGQLETTTVTPQGIIQCVRQNKAMIIYDGLDEITVHFTHDETDQFIAELWSIREIRDKTEEDNQGKLLVSCRTHYFRDISEQNSLFLARDRDGKSSTDYRSCTLLPFNDSQIREYLKKNSGSDEEEITRIIGLFEEVHNLKELAGRPYALALITEFIPELERLQREGKAINTAKLYELTIHNWLRRDEGRHKLSVPHIKNVMKALAFELHRKSEGGVCAEKLEEWFDTWLYHHPVITGAYGNVNRETLRQDLRTATFIIREQDKAFSFAHTSLQEYFLAGYLLDVLLSDNMQQDSLAITVPSNETLNFAAEMLTLDEELLGSSIKAIESILERSYQKGVSELSLALWMIFCEKGMRQPNPRTVHLEDADLTGWKIGKLNLCHACFDGATLKGTRFENAMLIKSSFRRCCLINAEFLSCNAEGADFSDAEAVGTVWRSSNLRDTEWQSANLRLAAFVNCDLTGSTNFSATLETSVAQCEGIENTRLPEAFTIDSFTGHSDWVRSCALSPDNKYIFSTSDDNTLKVWDFETGQCLQTLTGHSESISCCSLGNDNSYLVTGSFDKTLKVWNFGTGQCLQTLAGHSDWIRSCSLSHDNKFILSTSDDNTLKIWDLTEPECIKSVTGISASSRPATDNRAFIVHRTTTGHSQNISFCGLSQDDKYIFSTSDDNNKLKVRDFQTGELIKIFEGHSESVSSCALSHDNKYLLSGSTDKTLRVWNFETGELIKIFEGHSESVSSCALSNDNKYILSGSTDKTLRVWDRETGTCLRIFTGHSESVSSCALSNDNKYILSGSYDKTLKVWDRETGVCLRTLLDHSDWVRSCALSLDKNRYILAGFNENTLKVWDFRTGKCLKTFTGHSGSIYYCALSQDNRWILSSSADNTLKVWDIESGQIHRTFKGHTDLVRCCALSNDNKFILSGSYDKTLKVWEIESGLIYQIFKGHTDWVRCCALSHDNELILSGSSDKTLMVWDFKKGECNQILKGHSGSVYCCALSRDNKLILSGSSDNTLRVWDKTGECIKILKVHSGSVNCCAWSLDNTFILSGSSDKTLTVWNFQKDTIHRQFRGHFGNINSCALSHDNKYILSGSFDKTLKLWDVETGDCLRTITNLPQNETATWEEGKGQKVQKLLFESEGAWQWIGLSAGIQRLPVELLKEIGSA